MLYIISTPIGNLKDITLRAQETLQSVDAIICEDTRRASILLNHFSIKKPLYILNDFNENQKYPEYITRLSSGSKLALISDAGTPLISDPGYKLVRACLEKGIPVDVIPGASAITTALPISGLPPDKFFFLGFLPEKSGQRVELLKRIITINDLLKTTFIVFVSPYKLITTLDDMLSVFGDIEIVLAKELTKIHQQVDKKIISQFLEHFKKAKPKGEFVLLFNFNLTKTYEHS